MIDDWESRCRLCQTRAAADDLMVCGECGMRVARRYKLPLLHEVRMRDSESRRARLAKAEQERQRRDAELRRAGWGSHAQVDSVVYYVEIGSYIKIGYSKNLRSRLQALRVPVSDLLAVEPGGRSEEARRHEQFGHLRINKRWENFRPEPDLLEHIATTRATYGIPAWLTVKRRGKNGPVVIRRIEDPQ